MNRHVMLGSLLLAGLTLATPEMSAQTPRSTTYRGWEAWVLDNDLVRLHIVPEIGGRVIQFALGDKEFFWVNPQLAGRTSPETGLDADGAWLNYGGDKLWPAPQGWDNDQQWPGPPDAVLDGQPYRAAIEQNAPAIRLTSRDDPRSGIRFSRRIRLESGSSRVKVDATMTNIDTKPRRWGIWAHTQLDAGMSGSDEYNRVLRAWCPINPQSEFDRGYRVLFGEDDSPSFEVDAQRGLLKVSYHYVVGKVGLDSVAGWVATVDGRQGDVFVQRFTYEPGRAYPDDASVEFWHNGLGRIFAYNRSLEMADDRRENPYVFESEILSPFAALQPGESYHWSYEWCACRIGGDLPVVACNEAGVVSEPLTVRTEGNGPWLRGRFGVFHAGRLVAEALDDAGVVLAVTDLYPSHVSPHAPIVLNVGIALPDATRTVALVLQDRMSNRIGELTRAEWQ